MTTPQLLVLLGPMAVGKSTLAARCATSVRGSGRTAALVALDDLAAMALPTLPDWGVAARIWAEATRGWLGAGLDVVIAEGGSTPEEARRVVGAAPAGTRVHVVAVTCRFEDALARAQADPTRGVSREEAFLRGAHEGFARALPELGADLVLDTSERDVDDAVRQLGTLLRARAECVRSADGAGR